MQRKINEEAKVGLRFSIIVQDLNIHYFKSHRLSNTISIISKI